MTEVYVFKIMGDWQMVPTGTYELDFVKSENEVRILSHRLASSRARSLRRTIKIIFCDVAIAWVAPWKRFTSI